MVDLKGISLYVIFTFFLLPSLILAIRVLISYLGYRTLQLQNLFPFRKVVIALGITVILQGFIGRLFDILPLFFVLPIQIRPGSWSTRFSYISDSLGLVNWGYIIHVPQQLIIYNLVSNLITVVYLFFATKQNFGLQGYKRYTLWFIMSLSSLMIAYVK